MPIGHSWNLAGWMNALGIRRKEQPDVAHIVQPVSIVGDHSGFSAQVLPPMAWMGGYKGPTAGVRNCAQLISMAPGGSYIRTLITSASGNLLFGIVDPPAAVANLTVNLTKHDMGSTPTLSTLQLATVAVPPAGTNPRFVGSNGWYIQDLAYVPPGHAFIVWENVVNTATYLNIMYEDCPAQSAAR